MTGGAILPVVILTGLLEGACNLLVMSFIIHKKPRWRFAWVALAYHLGVSLAVVYARTDEAFSIIRTVINLAAFLWMTRYVFDVTGRRMWIGYLETECSLIALSLISSALMLLTPLSMNEITVSNIELLAMSAAYLLSAGALLGLIALGRRLMLAVKRNPALPYILRMTVAAGLIVTTVIARVSLPELFDLTLATNDKAVYLIVGMAFIACALAISFIYQDMRTLAQMRSNDTLERKQRNIDELLTSIRGFRHNIGNLLYGMEGAMATGDLTETKEYYRQLVEKCTLMNSENVIAVQNVMSPSLAGLLLHKLDAAYQRRIPIYLYVQPRVPVRGISQSDLCEVAGALMDNALEAAAESPAPYVSLELRSRTGEMELVVRNTFVSFEETLSSSKPGHEGVGVRSARQILKRHPSAFLNYRVAGRYVEAQVLIG